MKAILAFCLLLASGSPAGELEGLMVQARAAGQALQASAADATAAAAAVEPLAREVAALKARQAAEGGWWTGLKLKRRLSALREAVQARMEADTGWQAARSQAYGLDTAVVEELTSRLETLSQRSPGPAERAELKRLARDKLDWTVRLEALASGDLLPLRPMPPGLEALRGSSLLLADRLKALEARGFQLEALQQTLERDLALWDRLATLGVLPGAEARANRAELKARLGKARRLARANAREAQATAAALSKP